MSQVQDVYPAERDGEGDDEQGPDTDADADQDPDRAAEPAATGSEGPAPAPEGERSVHDTGHWRPGLLVALAAGAAGVLLGNTALFLSAAVGLVYAGYASATGAPDLYLEVTREFRPESPAPGERVAVRVTAENVGDRAIPDLRLVDDPPAGLDVVEGSPRRATSLRPGESVAFEYVLAARRGEHEFGDLTAVGRNASGGRERRKTFDVAATLRCHTGFEDLPLAAQTVPYAGRVPTDSGGEGVEFYATRQHHPTDPMRRIDWNRFARTGELTTVQFRETRAATVTFVVDMRDRVRRAPDEPEAVELNVYAAVRIARALLDEKNRVGAACYGTEVDTLSPGTGEEGALRVQRFLETALTQRTGRSERPAPFGSVDQSVFDWGEHSPWETTGGDTGRDDGARADGGSRVDWIRSRLPEESQVVFVSPLLDDEAVDAARRFEAYGHAVTVVSPDVTHEASPGGQIERLERRQRLRSLQALDADSRVVDWSPDEPLQTAVTRATRRWS